MRPPDWVTDLVTAAAAVSAQIDTTEARSADDTADITSDGVLSQLAPSLQQLGYQVESGKKKADKIIRPVLFGDDGRAEVSYEIDAFHDGMGIAVEVEAGRGAANGADYRDIVRTSLLLDANNLALFMPLVYRFMSSGKQQEKRAYDSSRKQINAIYASQRLRLPFDGLLLVGY